MVLRKAINIDAITKGKFLDGIAFSIFHSLESVLERKKILQLSAMNRVVWTNPDLYNNHFWIEYP